MQNITECRDHLHYAFPAKYLFKKVVVNPVLEISEDVYRPVFSKKDRNFFRNDWTVLAFRAFKLIQEMIPKRGNIGIVGTGGGLDALGAIEMFDPKFLAITDLSDAALNQSYFNILKNLLPVAKKRIEIKTQKSFLFNDFKFEANSFDFIYENLPNLPLKKITKIVKSNQPITASYYHSKEIEDYKVPKIYADRLLSLHWLFLKSAKKFLKEDGKVLCSIGGRMEYSLIEKMFLDAGYKATLTVYDFKRQNEAASNLPGYAAEEYKRIRKGGFRYFNYHDLLKKIAPLKYHKLKGFAEKPDSVKIILNQNVTSANNAYSEFKKNKTEIGHEVFFIAGTPLPK